MSYLNSTVDRFDAKEIGSTAHCQRVVSQCALSGSCGVVVDVLSSCFFGSNQGTERSYRLWFLLRFTGFTYLIGELHRSRCLVIPVVFGF